MSLYFWSSVERLHRKQPDVDVGVKFALSGPSGMTMTEGQ